MRTREGHSEPEPNWHLALALALGLRGSQGPRILSAEQGGPLLEPGGWPPAVAPGVRQRARLLAPRTEPEGRLLHSRAAGHWAPSGSTERKAHPPPGMKRPHVPSSRGPHWLAQGRRVENVSGHGRGSSHEPRVAGAQRASWDCGSLPRARRGPTTGQAAVAPELPGEHASSRRCRGGSHRSRDPSE